MTLSDRKDPDPFSKSQTKRDMLALQKLGVALVELPESQLEKIPLPTQLLEAIQFARTLKANESKRRHLQFIGKLMRDVDAAPIQAALEALRLSHHKGIQQFHKIEKWRDQLIAEGDLAIQKLLEIAPEVDRQQLRQLVRNAQRDTEKSINSGAVTELFRYLRELLFSAP